MFHLLMAFIIVANGQMSLATYTPDGEHEKLWASRAECEVAIPAIQAETQRMLTAKGLTRGTDYEFQFACDPAGGNPA